MAIADVTFHIPNRPFAELGNVWPQQEGDSVQLDFTSGTDETDAQTQGMLARIVSDADCRIAVIASGTATVANSRLVKSGIPEAAYVPEGSLISVRAA